MSKFLWIEPPNRICISRAELHIWRLDLGSGSSRYEKLIPILSLDEIQRAKTFVFKKDYEQYLATHIIKRLILSNYLNISPKLLKFEKNQWGKPGLSKTQNSRNVQFNISHSHNLVLIAVSIEDAVGIDVEYHAKKISIESLGRIIFSPLEKSFFLSFKSQQKRKELFFRCWTRKEAYLKARGIGLTMDLSNISVDLNETVKSVDWLKNLTSEQPEVIEWKLFPLEIENFYTAAVVATSFQEHLLSYGAEYLTV